MRGDNFIYFFTTCGFFIGLLFSIQNCENPFDILTYTALITFFFYIWIHVLLIFFSSEYKLGRESFPKNEHEKFTDYIIKEIEDREIEFYNTIGFIEKLMAEKDEKGKR